MSKNLYISINNIAQQGLSSLVHHKVKDARNEQIAEKSSISIMAKHSKF